MRRWAYLTIMFALFWAWFFLLRPASLGGPASYVIVSGTSMEPTLYTGDLVITRRQESYEVGDIVAFRVEDGLVIHRIVGGTAESGYVLRGDNRDSSDWWRPTPQEIAGRMWVRLPGMGRWVQRLREPASFAALVAVLGLISLPGLSRARRWRRRRMTARRDGWIASSTLGNLLGAAALAASLALVFGALAVYALRQPLQRTEQVERLRYEHAAAFSYTLEVAPSTLYPEGTVGPVTPAAAPARQPAGTAPPAGAGAQDQPAPGTAVYTREPRRLLLDIRYDLNAQGPAYVAGEYRVDLEVRAGADGWSKVLPLVEPAPFGGTGLTLRVPVDLAQVRALIAVVEEETGFEPGSYQLAVIPKIRVRGRVGDQPVDEVYAPPFRMTWYRSHLLLDDELARSEPRSVAEPVARPARLGLLGLDMPVRTARIVAIAGLVASLLGLSAAGGLLAARLRRDEAARIRLRYGSMIVAVRDVELPPARMRVQVASMSDLARIARQEGRQVLHRRLDTGADLYLVPDGNLVYEFRLPKRAVVEREGSRGRA